MWWAQTSRKHISHKTFTPTLNVTGDFEACSKLSFKCWKQLLMFYECRKQAWLTITLRIAFSSHATSEADIWAGLPTSSCTLLLEDIVAWEEPGSEVSLNLEAASASKEVPTSFNELILKKPSNRSLHIWSLNHSLCVYRVAFMIFISWGSSIPNLLPIATFTQENTSHIFIDRKFP